MENFRILNTNMDDNRSCCEHERNRCGCCHGNETRSARCCERETTRSGCCCENGTARSANGCCEHERNRCGCCHENETRSARCCERETTRSGCCRENGTARSQDGCCTEDHNHEIQGSVRLAGEGCEAHNHRFATVSGNAIDVGQSHVHDVTFTTDTYDGHKHEFCGRTSIGYPTGCGH